MPVEALRSRYSRVAITLHWLIAFLIVFNLTLGWLLDEFDQALHRQMVGIHAIAGLSVLALSLMRVLWRLGHAPPPLPADLAAWQRRAAQAVHTALYVMMLTMPLIGWAILSSHPPRAGGLGIPLVGSLELTPIGFISQWATPYQKMMHERFGDWHSIGAWIVASLLCLHVAGALKHQFIDKHAAFARMGLGRSRA